MVRWPIPRLDPPLFFWLMWLMLAALGLVIACLGFLAVRWLVRRFKPPREPGPFDAPPVIAAGAMTADESRDIYEQLRRWLKEGQAQTAVIQSVLQDLERFRERAEAAERRVHEMDQQRYWMEATERQCEQLRQELDRTWADLQRLRTERAELIQQMSEILLRLLGKSQ
jgi:polyhydroxyalkanoate synthesis regulator phasin